MSVLSKQAWSAVSRKVYLWAVAFLLMFGGSATEGNGAQEAAETKPHGTREGVEITVLYDNNPYDERLQTAWGFACLVEGLDKCILFDTGGSGAILLSNMRKLGIKPRRVDAVVISHVHYDHLGGLADFLHENHDVTVYLPRSLPAEIKRVVRKSDAELVEVSGPRKVCEKAYSTGELGTWIKEQSLIIETDKGDEDVYLALGGFHLCRASSRQIEQIVGRLQEERVKVVAPSHCSGEEARRAFEKAYGKNFISLGVGRELRILSARLKVCVYAGSGVVRARDVETALEKLGISCARLDRGEIRGGKLGSCCLLIMPGGRTGQMVKALGSKGLERIRRFVSAGGGYVGICAGAYIAAEKVEVPGRPAGLGIIDIRNRRKAGKRVRTIAVTKPRHTVFAGCGRRMRIWYENGPAIEPGEGVESLATYADGSAAIVCSTYGQGKVVIFSPHPEGTLRGRIDPGKTGTLKLLRNAVSFASSPEQ